MDTIERYDILWLLEMAIQKQVSDCSGVSRGARPLAKLGGGWLVSPRARVFLE